METVEIDANVKIEVPWEEPLENLVDHKLLEKLSSAI